MAIASKGSDFKTYQAASVSKDHLGLVRISNMAIVLSFCFIALPESLFDDNIKQLFGVPLYYFFTLMVFASLVMESILSETIHYWPVVLTMVWVGLMTLTGVILGNDADNILRDLVTFSALISGILYGYHRNLSEIIRGSIVVSVILIVIVATSWFLAFTGHISLNVDPRLAVQERPYMASVWSSLAILTITLPFIYCSSLFDLSYSYPRIRAALLPAGVVLTVFSSIVTVTRSELLWASFLVLVWCRVIIFRSGIRKSLLLLCILGFGVLCVHAFLDVESVVSPLDQLMLTERTRSTTIEEESRWGELTALFEQMAGDELHGKGLGSLFERYHFDQYAKFPVSPWPHMGVFGFYFKGGIFLMLGFALIPLMIGAKLFVSPSRWGSAGLAVGAAVLGYFCGGLTNSGMLFGELFLYGILLTMILTLCGSKLGASPIGRGDRDTSLILVS